MVEHILNMHNDGIVLQSKSEKDKNINILNFDVSGKSLIKSSDSNTLEAENSIILRVNDALIECSNNLINIRFKNSLFTIDESGIKMKAEQVKIQANKVDII